jgi:hypothetical protein
MTKLKLLFLVVLTAVLPLPGIVWSQSSPDEPLGDAAREQQKMGGPQKQVDRKVYRNRDIVSTPVERSVTVGQNTSNTDQTSNATTGMVAVPKATPEKGKDTSPQSDSQALNSSKKLTIFDRPDFDDDVIVVPAGTRIEIDLATDKVSLPVRVGFATPIPALSKVTTDVIGSTVCDGYDDQCDEEGILTLTSVTVGSVTYPVQAYGLTLTAPLAIKR